MNKYGLIAVVAITLSGCQSYAPINEPAAPGTQTPASTSQETERNVVVNPPPTPLKDEPNTAVLALLNRADSQLDQHNYLIRNDPLFPLGK